MSAPLRQTPLFAKHEAEGARIVDFAGWAMPVQYRSIVEEHHQVRRAAGLFDVSHMGRLEFRGPDATRFLDFALTRSVAAMAVGRIRYSFVCNHDGGILDDILAYRQATEDSQDNASWTMVVNASNREKLIDWFTELAANFEVSLYDVTNDTAMLALQGPSAVAIASTLSDQPIDTLKYFQHMSARLLGCECQVSRTGYTGEDGFEFICSSDAAQELWDALLAGVQAVGGGAAGLGARDTLRLEAALPLYGHELSASISPVQTGMPFAYDLADHDFAGATAVAKANEQPLPRLHGLTINGRRPAREGCRVLAAGVEIGSVTSGTMSPTLEKPIALAFLPADAAQTAADLQVDIRGKSYPAQLVELPFYKRPK